MTDDDHTLASRYFDDHFAPDLAGAGTPPEGLDRMREQYATGATGNPALLREIHDHYAHQDEDHYGAEEDR